MSKDSNCYITVVFNDGTNSKYEFPDESTAEKAARDILNEMSNEHEDAIVISLNEMTDESLNGYEAINKRYIKSVSFSQEI